MEKTTFYDQLMAKISFHVVSLLAEICIRHFDLSRFWNLDTKILFYKRRFSIILTMKCSCLEWLTWNGKIWFWNKIFSGIQKWIWVCSEIDLTIKLKTNILIWMTLPISENKSGQLEQCLDWQGSSEAYLIENVGNIVNITNKDYYLNIAT